MASEKEVNLICTIQRGLGIVEGVAIGIGSETVSAMLYTATEMIEAAVEELTKDGK